MTTTALALPSGFVRLTDWGLIRASGPDAMNFLQGQLTNDLNGLPLNQARLAGYCSAKGRLLASFIVWRESPEEWLLACSADVLPATIKRLSMFVMRARCKLSDASAQLALWGQAAAPAELSPESAGTPVWGVAVSSPGAQAIRLPDAQGVARFLWASPTDQPAPGAGSLPLDAWRWLEVASGVARISQPTAEAFVPQMVNLELVGGVSFKKGCYPGQEVVARSQYRGTLKRRGALLVGAAPMQPGQELFHSADPGQPAGVVVLAAPAPDGSHWALAELKLAALTGGSLHLGSAEGSALSPRALPYALPGDEA